jgi:hypothetical protein
VPQIVYSPFALLVWTDLRRFVYDRDQLTYGREFEAKMAFYMSFVVACRFTFAKVDDLVKKALRVKSKQNERALN